MRHVDVPAKIADALIAQLRGDEKKPAGGKRKPGTKNSTSGRPK